MGNSRHPVLEPHVLEGLCKVIGDTSDGLTGSEISQLLHRTKIVDVDSSATKWRRLYYAFSNWQDKNQCSNNILDFVKAALQPVNYVGKRETFDNRRNEVNKRLCFIGVEVTEKGTLIKIEKVYTVSEAEERASQLINRLTYLNVHDHVLQYCRAELLVDNYFHSVFEATKSVADRIRKMTGLYADGNALVETAFSTSNPLIKVNLLITDTDRSEHIGLLNLIKGVFGLIRNPTAHEPKIKFNVSEEEALDILNTISFIHKRLDKAL